MKPEEILDKQNQKWQPEHNARYVRWEAALAAMYEYARTEQKLNIHSVVRGGAIEAQSVPLEGEGLKWTNSAVTQITPTEPSSFLPSITPYHSKLNQL